MAIAGRDGFLGEHALPALAGQGKFGGITHR